MNCIFEEVEPLPLLTVVPLCKCAIAAGGGGYNECCSICCNWAVELDEERFMFDWEDSGLGIIGELAEAEANCNRVLW